MKVFIRSFVIILLLSCTSLFSQVNSNYDGPKPEVEKGAKSFIFKYTPFQSNLEPVYVGTTSWPYGEGQESINLVGAGFRYFVTNQIALGLGLSFGTETTTTQETNGDKNENTETDFGIGLDANYHLKSLYSVSPYVGLNINYALYSRTDKFSPDGGATATTDYSGNGFGIAAQCGFDWYFTEGLSLGGKYALGFQSLGKPEVKYDDDTTEEGPSTTAFGISTFSVILNVHL